MIHYYTKKAQAIIECKSNQASSWIHIDPNTPISEIEQFASLHEIPVDFLTDPLDIDERSRYEREDDIKLIIINIPILNATDKEGEAIFITTPLGIIITLSNIITICAFDNEIVDKILENRVKNIDPADHKMFVLKLFEHTVYHYLECLKKLNLRRNLIEQELYHSSRNKELKELLRVEKSLVYFLNSLSTNELLKMKMKRTDFLDIKDLEDHADLFEDIIIDNSQALEMSNIYTNILSGTMEAYASIVSNNMNVFINRLTIITIILMVPTLVASFFGMNVNIPFSDNPYSFYIIFLLSLFLGSLLIWFFRRRQLF